MFTFQQPGERVFVLLASGSLSLSQSVLALLQKQFDQGTGLAAVSTMYEASRVVGQQVRKIDELDRRPLERDNYHFNVHFILGGQIRGEPPALYMIYPQGNAIRATTDWPYLQIGETKYGWPILDRGVRYGQTSLEEAAKYALLSIDSTMRSNVTVGPPVDLLVYPNDEFRLTRHRRFPERDPDWLDMHNRWEQALRQAVLDLPDVRFDKDR
jgi:putative proteasome-type protease